MRKNNEDFVDPDLVSRPLVGIGMRFVTGPRGLEIDKHRHRKAQLIFTERGLLKCEVPGGLWIVPPRCAVWIPGGIEHSVKGSGTIEAYVLFVESSQARTFPDGCCTVSISPLLRELLLRCSDLPIFYPIGGPEARLAEVFLDQLASAPVENLHLPMPSDTRLRKIADRLTSDPSDRATVHEWARRVGASERTLARLIVRETGMSFGRWRQQLQIILALQWLSKGDSVQSVADHLGYENASSFIVMFRQALGVSPARYMSGKFSGSTKPLSVE